MNYDPSVSPLKFNQVKKQNLIIGYYFDDGIAEISEANRHAVLIVKNALEEQGHTLVEFNLCSGARGQSFLQGGLPLAY